MNKSPKPDASGRAPWLAIPPEILAYAIKAANILASFGFVVLLARAAGAETVGHYNLAFATAGVAVTLGLGGLDRIMMRTIAGDLREGKNGEAASTLWRIARHVGVRVAVLGVLLTALVVFGPLAQWLNTLKGSLALAGLIVVVHAFLQLGIAAVRASGMDMWGQVLEALHSTILALVMLGLVAMAVTPTALMAVSLLILSMAVTVALSWGTMRRQAARWGPPSPSTLGPLEPLGRPFMLATLGFSAGTFGLFALISHFGSAAEVGAFRTAFQVAMLVAVLLSTGENYVTPRLAGDWRVGDLASLWQRFRRATLIMAVCASPIILACLLFPEWILTTLFGPEFAKAAGALRILALAQAISLAMGPINAVLAVAGREKILMRQSMIGLAIMILLAALLLPTVGLVGAALADLGARSYRGLAGTIYAWRHLRTLPA
mgnify:CR=1 FL=1